MHSPRVWIGNQTAASATTPLEPFLYALEHGFDAFEWFPDRRAQGEGWEEGDLSGEARRTIRETARARGIRLSVHAPWWGDPLDPTGAERLLVSATLARDIGACLVNLHLHTRGGPRAFLEALVPLARFLDGTDIRVALENTPETGPEAFNELFRCLPDVPEAAGARLGMCLDVGHANLCEVTRNDYLRFLDLLDPSIPIIHVHMHENHGEGDRHMTVFTGPSAEDDAGIRGVMERLGRRGYAGSIILEQWPQPPSLLDQARDRLLGMVGRGEEPEAGPPPGGNGDEAVEALVRLHRTRSSWRKRLEGISSALADPARARDPAWLAALAVYLRFIGTGALACGEDGGHFRPSHHARISQKIHRQLASASGPETRFLLRRIYPWLPSCDEAFLRSEPLTRIRDIAHRNDIPRELKQEIKRTLQNKLHRCADPGDLETSARLLERIREEADEHPRDFVEQFERFHRELEDFFNAGPLHGRLEALMLEAPETEDSIRPYLVAAGRATTRSGRVLALERLTDARWHLRSLEDGGAGDVARHRRLGEIALEDQAFALLSERVPNRVPAAADGWEREVRMLRLAVVNLGLSDAASGECEAIASELTAWGASLDSTDLEQLLRLRATLERCGRMVAAFTDGVLRLFQSTAERLGGLLGAPRHAVRSFSEGAIRGSLAFQVSTRVERLLGWVRERAGLGPWETVVAGEAQGRVTRLPRLEEDVPPAGEPIIAWVDRVNGDEDLPEGVVALLLAGPLPHLSHLAIRARQAGVIVATHEGTGLPEPLEARVGSLVSLAAGPEGVRLGDVGQGGQALRGRARRPVIVPPAARRSDRAWIPLEEITAAEGGAKALGARRLAELAGQPDAGFRTPPGGVIPHGVLWQSLDADVAARERHDGLVARLERGTGEEDGLLAAEIRALLAGLPVPPEAVDGARHIRTGRGGLVVRSSSNLEDLQGTAGAGLFASVVGVLASGLDAAIREVWASLWSERAVRSRRRTGVAQASASMAVLIQKLVDPDLSFVVHTESPLAGDADEMLVELVVGLGETLTSAGEGGSPYRMSCSRSSGAVRTLALASISHALHAGRAGGLVRRRLDYAGVPYTRDAGLREALCRDVARVSARVEAALGGAQDLEGVVREGVVYLVQARPQQGTGGSRVAGT